MPTISIVIPAYNEEQRLPTTLKTLQEELMDIKMNINYEVIVVDDGSIDRTAEIADFFGTHVLKVSHQGKGGALLTGMAVSKGDAVVLCDADLPCPIWEIQRLAKIVLSGTDLAIGSRRVVGAVVGRHWSKRFLGWCFNACTRLIAGLSYKDTQCGVKVISRSAVDKILPILTEHGFAVDVDLLLAAKHLKLFTKEVGIHWLDKPGSKVHPIRDAWRMFIALLRLKSKYILLHRHGVKPVENLSYNYLNGSVPEGHSSM